MRYFPIFLDLQGQAVLVVGGGTVAERKIRLLLKAGAMVQVVAGTINENLRELAAREKIDWTATAYDPVQLEGTRLVYAATSDRDLNARVHRDADRKGIPVNVVDDLEHCRFITPAIVDRAPLQIAISTSGSAPVLARTIRNWLEQLLPAGIANVATAAGRLRPYVNKRLGAGERRKFWDRLFTHQRLQDWSELNADEIGLKIQRTVNAEQTLPAKGKVYLVGAGPGRPDLLTVRAMQLLGQADIILHDKLVPDEILDLARRDAEFLDVGKRAGSCHRTQQQVNALMVKLARSGRQVVRLKGGDPFIFGRGGEEMQQLEENGIECEVVPGITAAAGCASAARIPLTHRDHAQALSLVTGHLAGKNSTLDWHSLAGQGKTVVVYMGVGQAAHIRKQLLESGIDAELPVALVADGTREDQQVVTGDVDSLPALARSMKSGAAGLLIIGEVARFAGEAVDIGVMVGGLRNVA